MKTTKGGKVMNPTDAYRKELRKKELKRNKKERKKVREVGILKKDPEALREQIQKLEMMKADGALDKARKHKKRQLEDTLNLVLKKKREYEDKMREKGEAPVMFSHLGPPRRRTSAGEEERIKHPKPEDSVYYHPTLNPTGAPPPGKPPMYKSSIGPRIPLPTSTSAEASSSKSAESEDAALGVPPPPPTSPPLPETDVVAEASAGPSSLPLPPPPPLPPKPVTDTNTPLPPPPFPPPPPGPPPKETALVHTRPPPPPPPSLQRPLQPPPPGTGLRDMEATTAASEGSSAESDRVTALRPPPPPPGLPPKPAHLPAEGPSSEPSSINAVQANMPQVSQMLPPHPRQPPPVPNRVPLMPPSQSDMIPPGIARLPPPPPQPDMRPPLPVPGLLPPPPPPPPGMAPPPMLRPPFAAPPGPGGLFRPPASPMFPPPEDDLASYRPSVPPKPSYVKAAASTVVKRPLAQHTPELTAMVPASVRVRRESAVPKGKPKPQLSAVTSAPRPSAPVVIGKSEVATGWSAPKAQSIDDSYNAFLEDMKALGALDS